MIFRERLMKSTLNLTFLSILEGMVGFDVMFSSSKGVMLQFLGQFQV